MPRKHKGIIQKGGNKGKLKKGYKFTGKRTKTGMPIIKKCKRKYKQKGGNKSFINQIVGDNGVYVINLKHRIDRWGEVKKQLDERNITYTRVEATYGKNLTIDEMKKYWEYHNNENHGIKGQWTWRLDNIFIKKYLENKDNVKSQLGQIGCAVSHINLWHSLKDKLKTDNDWILIMEDDMLFIEDINKAFKKTWDKIPKETGMIYLNFKNNCENKKIVYKDEVVTACKFSGTLGTTAYMVNKSGLDILLNNIKYPINKQIDVLMRDLTIKMNGTYGIRFNKSCSWINCGLLIYRRDMSSDT
jgi:GR25 family glycosyltransferase involved in LPS biosynthesis